MSSYDYDDDSDNYLSNRIKEYVQTRIEALKSPTTDPVQESLSLLQSGCGDWSMYMVTIVTLLVLGLILILMGCLLNLM